MPSDAPKKTTSNRMGPRFRGPCPRGLLMGSIGLALGWMGCASSSESLLKEHVAQNPRSEPSQKALPKETRAQTGSSPGTPRQADPVRQVGKGSVQSYVARALRESPELEAAFQRWRASVHKISRARRMPDLVLSFGYFVRSVETRVGPQRARIGLSQTFPWPTRLTASADAASATAKAAESQFDALALQVRGRVVAAYYRLWLVRELRKLHAEHLEILRSLSETILARVATGATSLADQQQVDLSAARLEDVLAGMAQEEVGAIAQLRAAIGTREPGEFPTLDSPPEALLPAERPEALEHAAIHHPLLESFEHRAIAQDETARALRAEGLPSLSIGADWIIVGQARMAGVEDSGKDAVLIGGGVSLPLWGSYGENAEAARAEARATRSDRRAFEDQSLAALQATLAQVNDAVRRIATYRHTLVPQAESAYASVLGSYAVGRGTVAQALLAQKDLLDLRVELKRACADYSSSWARLEQIVGRNVEPAAAPPSKTASSPPVAGESSPAPATSFESSSHDERSENED